MVREGIDGSDDWGHVAADLGWLPMWHVVVVALGVVGYAATIRMAARLGVFLARGKPARLLIPYISACIFATILGALWHGGPAASALDGFLSFAMAPLGYLLAIRVVAKTADTPPLPPVERNYTWIVSVAVIAATFALTVARGVGRLA
jgi:hypothetical protein